MGFQEPSSGKIAEIALCKHWPHHRNHRNIMGEITTTSKVQTDGIEQINQTVEPMDPVTQSNAALRRLLFHRHHAQGGALLDLFHHHITVGLGGHRHLR